MPRCADASCARWRPALGAWGSGLRLNGAWFCSRPCAETAVRQGLESPPVIAESASALPPLRLGALLRHQGVLTSAQLEQGLAAQRDSGLKLGAQLKALGFVSSDALVRALAAQAGISYLTTVDLARVRRAPGGLSADMVRALGLLPFEADDRRLHVICTAPLPKAALRALARLTGWAAEPYLVDDQLWERALDFYAAAGDGAHSHSEVVHDVHAASAHVVQAAAAGRDVTVRYAGCGDFVWARVEDKAHTQDVLVQAH